MKNNISPDLRITTDVFVWMFAMGSLNCESDRREITLYRIPAAMCFSVIVHCRDTDVLVLLVHFASGLGGEIWFGTGTSQKRRFVAVHKVDVDPVLRQTFPAFHALTGCDTVSQFHGIGKKSAWKVLLTNAVLLSGLGTGGLSDKVLRSVEEFVCELYAEDTTDKAINALRYKLFKKGCMDPEKLPPTQQCLQDHIKSAHFQSLVWYSAAVAEHDLPSPVGYGWYEDPITRTLRPEIRVKDPVPSVCLELIHCKNCSTARCRCRANKMTCTGACGCCGNMCANPFSAQHEDSLDDDF